jgi:hypothetical protein
MLNTILLISLVIAILIVITILAMAVGRFLKKCDSDLDRIMKEERRRRFWGKKREGLK